MNYHRAYDTMEVIEAYKRRAMDNYPLHINSEIGTLKSVLLHRPGEELEGLVPEYLERLLFDDIPYLKNAQIEHDAFADVLRSRGIEVLYLDDMVTEALQDDEVRKRFVSEMVRASKQGDRRVTHALIDYLLSMDTKAMVRKVMAGIRKDEVPLADDEKVQLHQFFASDYPFYLDPMPNLYFTRDPAATIGSGLTINKMHWPARRRESLFMDYIVKYHPRFANFDIPVWYERDGRFSIEGGDELVLSNEVVAIGVSERTTPEAIEKTAARLFARSEFKKVLAIEIPKTRAFMHLDTVFTMIDYDKFTIHPAILDGGGNLNVYSIERTDDPERPAINHFTDLARVLADALHKPSVTLIPCGGGEPIAAAREQWNDGSNTLTIAPGVVVTYDRNYVTNAVLREHGIEVIEIEGAELGRGRGGPRCMSMPLWREDI